PGRPGARHREPHPGRQDHLARPCPVPLNRGPILTSTAPGTPMPPPNTYPSFGGQNPMSDSWRPAPRRRLGDLSGKAVVIIVILAILVLAGFGIHRLLTSDSARAADEQVEQVARIIADARCIRIEGTTLPGTSVPTTSYAGTLCDETVSGTLQVDRRQPAGYVM